MVNCRSFKIVWFLSLGYVWYIKEDKMSKGKDREVMQFVSMSNFNSNFLLALYVIGPHRKEKYGWSGALAFLYNLLFASVVTYLHRSVGELWQRVCRHESESWLRGSELLFRVLLFRWMVTFYFLSVFSFNDIVNL